MLILSSVITVTWLSVLSPTRHNCRLQLPLMCGSGSTAGGGVDGEGWRNKQEVNINPSVAYPVIKYQLISHHADGNSLRLQGWRPPSLCCRLGSTCVNNCRSRHLLDDLCEKNFSYSRDFNLL